MRSIRTLTLAALAGVAVLALAACGSSSSSSSGNASITVAGGIQTPATESLTGGKKGGTLTVLNHEDFEHIDPGQSYFSIDYEAVYATQRPLYSYKPNTFKETTPDMAEGPPQISSDAQDRHGAHPQRRALQPAGEPRSHARPTSPTRSTAAPTRTSPTPTSSAYFSSVEGASKANGGPIPGIQTPGQVHDRLPPDRTEGADRRGRARAAGERAGARGIREEVRRQETQRIRQLPGRHGAVHVEGEQRRQGARRGLPAGQVGDARAQPQLERRRRTSGPPTSTRSTSRSAATRTSSAARCWKARAWCRTTRPRSRSSSSRTKNIRRSS